MNFKHIYGRLRKPGDTLSERVVHGGIWVFILRIVNRIFGLIRIIILARLLAPNDFGLFGIAMLALATLQGFSRTGFDQALIQKKEDTEPYLNSAWTVQIIRGFILAIILLVGAPLVGIFFEEPRAIMLVRVLGASVFLESLKNIGIVYFQKEMEFHKQFVYQFSGTIADIAVAIPAALILRSVWALVFGLLAGNFVRVIVSYIIHPYRPSFRLDWDKNKELFNFGRWILGSGVLVFLITQGDDIFVGKLLGVTMLGFYQMAYRISNMPATEITHVISQVTFPAYSKLQDDIPKLREAYLKVLQATSFLSFPIAGLIFVLAPDFTRIFLGEKWMPMVPAIMVLVWWGVIRSLVASMSPIFLAVGKPNILTKMQFFQTILLFTLIYPLSVNYSIMGTSLAVLFSAILMFFIRNRIFIRTIRCKSWLLYRNVFYPMIITAISGLLIIFTKISIFDSVNIYQFFLLIVIFVLIVSVLSLIIDKFAIFELKPTLRDVERLLWKK